MEVRLDGDREMIIFTLIFNLLKYLINPYVCKLVSLNITPSTLPFPLPCNLFSMWLSWYFLCIRMVIMYIWRQFIALKKYMISCCMDLSTIYFFTPQYFFGYISMLAHGNYLILLSCQVGCHSTNNWPSVWVVIPWLMGSR